jgi:hydroxypyruvate reductase
MALDPRSLLRAMFDAAVGAADPERCVTAHLPPEPDGRMVVVGAGKAAASMARAVERQWRGALSGLVVTRYGHGVPCRRIEVVEAAHPVPDAAGLAAAARILEMVSGLTAGDLVLCLLSGGGSALLSLPAPGLKLADKQAATARLIASGATIAEINSVRKHLSAIKGGRLAAAAAPARVVTLLISDVPGDDPAVIASGPTVADATTFADALAVMDKYGLEEPAAVVDHLRSGAEETPKPGDRRLAGSRAVLIATARDALAAAAAVARKAGVSPVILGDAVEGEAREVARAHARLARAAAHRGEPAKPPCVLVSGGETTVTLTHTGGRGGPNCEYLLALALALDGEAGVHALACDTDGIDGSEDNAGAIIAPDSLARAEASGLDARASLAGHDSYGFFAALGDLVVTGVTRTNVNDFRAILVAGRA